jgi:hypothetical protein
MTVTRLMLLAAMVFMFCAGVAAEAGDWLGVVLNVILSAGALWLRDLRVQATTRR